MHYLSIYLPENVLDEIEANTNFYELEDAKIVSDLAEKLSFIKFNDSDIIQIKNSSNTKFKNSTDIQFRNSSDIELNNSSGVQFRNSSDIKLEKKPCGCMANKIKETPSS